MPIKLGNNARAHLAAPLAADGTTIVLVANQVGNFPALSAGEWFPLTLTDAAGRIEIVRVTARSSNLLTATRAQEATTALAWLAGDRAEIRMTAAAVHQLQTDAAQAKTDANAYTDTRETSIRSDLSTAATNYTNTRESSIRSDLNTAIGNETTNRTNAISSLTTTVGTKFDKAGGSVSGNVSVTGTISATSTISAPTIAASTSLTAGGQTVWNAGNFDPSAKLNLTGGTMTGAITQDGGDSFTSAGWAAGVKLKQGSCLMFRKNGQTHAHSYGVTSNIHYWLTSTVENNSAAGTTLMQLDNSGNLTATGNVTAYSDARFKTDLQPITGALGQIARMPAYTYVHKITGARHLGLIAQDVQRIRPEAVQEDKDGYLSVAYGNLVALAFAGLNELHERVRALEREA